MANKEVNFKVLSAELDKLLLKLQDQNTGLDEAITLFKKGRAIVDALEKYLLKAENTIRSLTNEKSKK